MDDLRAELARKKEAAQAQKAISGSRFIRRGDVDREEEVRRKAEAEKRKQELEDRKRKREEDLVKSRGQASILVSMTAIPDLRGDGGLKMARSGEHGGEERRASNGGNTAMSVDEVKTRLRELGKEVTLFGETDEDRQARLTAVEAELHHDDFELDVDRREKNPFLGRGANEANTGGKRDGAHTGADDTGEAHSDKEDEEDDKEEHVSDYTLVRRFFKKLIKEWEEDLNARPEAMKSSVAGRRDTRTQKQSKDYLRPLFKLCKTKEINPGILVNLVKMVSYMSEGEFVKAHDMYMLTAIGNAPWPIGLTMVGIHERSGREKIESRNVAHIMNNEAQRKYLVAIKRLMTYLQDKRVDVPPSKKVR